LTTKRGEKFACNRGDWMMQWRVCWGWQLICVLKKKMMMISWNTNVDSTVCYVHKNKLMLYVNELVAIFVSNDIYGITHNAFYLLK
jgi:hypothetical protein